MSEPKQTKTRKGLRCPKCGGVMNSVRTSQVSKGAAIRRRRRCATCSHIVSTEERPLAPR